MFGRLFNTHLHPRINLKHSTSTAFPRCTEGQWASDSSMLVQETGLSIAWLYILYSHKSGKNPPTNQPKNSPYTFAASWDFNVTLIQFKMNYRFLNPVLLSFERDEVSCFGIEIQHALNMSHSALSGCEAQCLAGIKSEKNSKGSKMPSSRYVQRFQAQNTFCRINLCLFSKSTGNTNGFCKRLTSLAFSNKTLAFS